MRRVTRVALCGAAVLVLFVVLCAAAGAQGFGQMTAVKLAAGSAKGVGVVDADVRTPGGRTLGYLQGDINRSGVGLLTFRPLAGVRQAGAIVVAHSRAAAHRRVRVTGRGRDLRIAATVDRRGRLSGSGRLAGADVRLTGVGREA